jgi:hypothetical protein
MPFKIKAGNNLITLPDSANNYTNCHAFSAAVINSLGNLRLATNIPENFRRALARAWTDPTNAAPIIPIYTQMVQEGWVRNFNRDYCAGLQIWSLIIFCNAGIVSHSMIVTGNDEWIGSNNVGSLSIQNSADIGVQVQE